MVRNLEQKKYIATVVFNLNPNQPQGTGADPHYGVVLTHTGGKLIGIVFTKVPLPDLNPQQGTPQQGMNMPVTSAAGGVQAATGGMPQQQQQQMPNTSGAPTNPVMTSANITPAMLAQLQQTANMGLINAAANNPNVQQQLQMRQQQMMAAAAAAAAGLGSPAQNNAQQQGQGQQQNMNGKILDKASQADIKY